MIAFDETLQLHGIKVPLAPTVITPDVEASIREGRYKKDAVEVLRTALRPGDRLLEIGTGLGVASSVAAHSGIETILSIATDPNRIPFIEATWALNGVKGASVRSAIGDANLTQDGSLQSLIGEFRPTVIYWNVGATGIEAFAQQDMRGVRHLIVEFRPEAAGEDDKRALVDLLACKDFLATPDRKAGATAIRFDPVDLPVGVAPDTHVPRRAYRVPPQDDPRILVATCMKNEGPFILEWIAYHRAIGVTDFVVFTNDCSDGTDRLLDRLDEMGIVQHLPNPASVLGSTYFQPAALRFVHDMPVFKRADYMISMDVDEFLNIRCGNGRLPDLFRAAGAFDALSMSEINHGSNSRLHFEPGWVTAQFPAHQTSKPGKWKANRGVKTITRLSPRLRKIRNHRPDFFEDLGTVFWRDGSGRLRPELTEDGGSNGWDVRGTFDLVSLDHYPLRSLEDYLVKMHRGDVVVKDKRVSERYWRLRNHATETSSDFSRILPRAKSEYEALLADQELAHRQDACVAAHRARISEISTQDDFVRRKKWIFENAWDGDIPEAFQTEASESR